MIGGDITYDNNMFTCYNTWDLLLQQVPHFRQEGSFIRLIPLIMATGNHDVGMNSNNEFNLTFSPHEPVFFHFFPQSVTQSTATPFEARKSYFSHSFGESLMIVSLDTAYFTLIKDQNAWLSSSLSQNHKVKFAHYHQPAYPSCKKSSHNAELQIRENWIPIFDNFGLNVAMENHVHSFKKTSP